MSVRPSSKFRSSMRPSEPITVPEHTAANTLKSEAFIAACKAQDVEPTKRQAARYNARSGRWRSWGVNTPLVKFIKTSPKATHIQEI